VIEMVGVASSAGRTLDSRIPLNCHAACALSEVEELLVPPSVLKSKIPDTNGGPIKYREPGMEGLKQRRKKKFEKRLHLSAVEWMFGLLAAVSARG